MDMKSTLEMLIVRNWDKGTLVEGTPTLVSAPLPQSRLTLVGDGCWIALVSKIIDSNNQRIGSYLRDKFPDIANANFS